MVFCVRVYARAGRVRDLNTHLHHSSKSCWSENIRLSLCILKILF